MINFIVHRKQTIIIMKYVVLTTQILLGLIFLIFGLNGFYTFIPVPEFHPFMKIMVDSGFIYVIKSIEVIAGILLLSNRFVLLSIVLLTPIIINIVFYHLLLDHRNWQITLIISLLHGIIIGKYWKHFIMLLQAKTIS